MKDPGGEDGEGGVHKGGDVFKMKAVADETVIGGEAFDDVRRIDRGTDVQFEGKEDED